jgi:hypothetical protein
MPTKVEKLNLLRREIDTYFESHGYHLDISLEKQGITAKAQPIAYTCVCNTPKTKAFKEILSRGCRECTELALRGIPTDDSVCPKDDAEEKWTPVEGGFVSSKARACNALGRLLTMDEKSRYFLAGHHQYVTILMAVGFKIKDYEKLNGSQCSYIVRNDSDKEVPHLTDIRVGTRSEIAYEAGTRSRQSEEFQSKLKMSVIRHREQFKYVILPELPHHLIFEDGNIYNDGESIGCKRFLTFSKSTTNDENPYYRVGINNKTYLVHRLVCIAFYPKEGYTVYDDYSKKWEVNHKNGNTLDNQISNLEWNDHSQNMIHAYQNKLNNKVQGVIQYEKLDNDVYGKEIARYDSIAEACRQTKVPEHEIREVCNKKGNAPHGFLWKFQDENKAAEYSKKFNCHC